MAQSITEKPKRRTVDWEGMEPHWRAGILSVSKLSEMFGVSRAGIHKHWDGLKVGRDLSGRITAEANAIVARQEVAAARLQARVTESDPVTDAETVSTNAQAQADIILAERRDVQRLRGLFNAIVVEMEDRLKPVSAEGGKEVPAAPAIGVRLDQLRKATETLKTIVSIERQVNNIADDTPVDPAARVAEAVENGFEGLRAAFNQKLGRTA